MANPAKLTGLRPQAYEHPSDAAALNALQHTPGLEAVLKKLSAWGVERFTRIQFTGSYLRVTADNLPDLHRIVTTAADRLDLPFLPELYVTAASVIGASTAGIDRPLVHVTAGAAELLTPDELLFVVAREVGHIKSGHLLYRHMAEFFSEIMEWVGSMTLGIGDLISKGVEVALKRWQRLSELTADRAGLLACQNVDVAFRTMMKMAGLPPRYFPAINTEDFLTQAREFQEMDKDSLNALAKLLSGTSSSHPWMVMRAQEVLKWIDSGGYEEVLRAPQSIPVQLPAGVKCFCKMCGLPLRGSELFCPSCGGKLTAARAIEAE